jgi:hypothetical protein
MSSKDLNGINLLFVPFSYQKNTIAGQKFDN